MALELPLPHFHLSGLSAVGIFLIVFVIAGTLHLLAASFPENPVSRAYVGLGF